MQIDDVAHGQDDEFTAEFDQLTSGAPADNAREPGGGESGGEDAGDQPAPKEGAPEAPTPEAKDPWAEASPDLIAERDRLLGELDRAKHSDQSQRGRVASMQRTIEQLRSITPPPQPQENGNGEGDKGGDAEAQERADRLKNLREDYPDLAGPILDLLDEARSEIKALGGRVNPVIDASNEAAIAAQEKVLTDTHPDWRTVGESGDFSGWISTQPQSIQALATSFDASEVSAVLTLFKGQRDASKDPAPANPAEPAPKDQPRDDRRERQLNGARDRPSRGAPAATGAPDEFEGAFNFFADKRKRQQK